MKLNEDQEYILDKIEYMIEYVSRQDVAKFGNDNLEEKAAWIVGYVNALRDVKDYLQDTLNVDVDDLDFTIN